MPHVLACERVRVEDCPARLPARFIEALEHNQKIASCCRHPENHEVEAWFSSEEDARRGIPDIYKFHCTCGRVHTRFMVGGGPRPYWEIR